MRGIEASDMDSVNLRAASDWVTAPGCQRALRRDVRIPCRARLLLAALVVLQPALLSGCVAAVVPVMAGGLAVRTRMDGKPGGLPKGEHRNASPTTSAALPPSGIPGA